VILGTMIGSAEAAGPGREGHSRRVASITRDLTDSLGWPPLRVRGMELAGLFLDIGMLVLPSDLLAPRGPLEPDAVELLHGHADLSGDILEPLARVGLPVAAVRAHHERLDGSGYPRGLRGRQIPFGAQVLGVVDTWAALTRPRPHRPAMSEQDALAVLRQQASLGRLSGKLVDALEPLVTPARPGAPPLGGLDRGAGGLQPDGEPEDPDDPSSPSRHLAAASQAASGLALSL
jgi:HD-GYP domain-containing protein (c-di-GMP phosphodiesterase class II)